MKNKHSIQKQLNDFLEDWGYDEIENFFRYVEPLIKLYDISEDDDWVKKTLECDDDAARNIRLIRTVYIVSRMCETFGGRFCTINLKHKGLWKRLEKEGVVESC